RSCTTRDVRSGARSIWSAQSPGRSSARASATGSMGSAGKVFSPPTSGAVIHALRQLEERTSHHHARRVRGGLAQRVGDLLVAVAELDLENDPLLLLFGQSSERGFVALHRVASDHLLDHREPAIGKVRRERLTRSLTRGPPDLVPQRVEQDPAEIREERALPDRLELPYMI